MSHDTKFNLALTFINRANHSCYVLIIFFTFFSYSIILFKKNKTSIYIYSTCSLNACFHITIPSSKIFQFFYIYIIYSCSVQTYITCMPTTYSFCFQVLTQVILIEAEIKGNKSQ